MRGVSVAAAVLILLAPAIAGVPDLRLVASYHSGDLREPGKTVNETIALPVNGWVAYRMFLLSSDRIHFEIEVEEGTPIDLYIVGEQGFQDYAGETALVFESYFDIRSSLYLAGVFTGVRETVYFVIDNVDFSGAEPTGNVTAHVGMAPEPSAPLPDLVLLVCGLGLGLTAFVAIALTLRNRRKRREAALRAQVDPASLPRAPTAPWDPPTLPPPPPPPPPED